MKTFEITRGDTGSVPLLTLQGKLTLGEGSRELRSAIERIAGEGAHNIILDLAGVSYVDSSGLGSMVAGYNAVKTQGGAVGLVNVPKRLEDLLSMSGLTAVLRIFPTKEEAARHFAAGHPDRAGGPGQPG